MDNLEHLVEAIINEPNLSGRTYAYLILGTENSFTSGYFAISENGFAYDGTITVALFNKYTEEIEEIMLGKGVLCIRVDAGQLVEHGIVKDGNPELFDSDLLELIVHQRYHLEPAEQERKEVLQASLKAEKVKQSLVFACYMNDMERIKALVTNASKSNLDKVLQYSGTALQFCSKYNNLEAFKLLAEKGASVGKRAISQTPLEIAFKHSSEIVNYIASEFPEVYQKEVKKKGFGIAFHCKDEALLADLLKFGFDLNQEKKPFPPLHSFADYDNSVGIEFLLKHGANIECRNQYKQTALHRAIRRENIAAIAMLLQYGASIDATDEDQKTAVELARGCANKAILTMME